MSSNRPTDDICTVSFPNFVQTFKKSALPALISNISTLWVVPTVMIQNNMLLADSAVENFNVFVEKTRKISSLTLEGDFSLTFDIPIKVEKALSTQAGAVLRERAFD